MATTYGMGGGTPIMSTTMPPPPSGMGGMATPMATQNMGSINTGGFTRNMSLPLASNRPINVDENTPNLEEIQGFPVAGRSLDGAHFHQDPVTGQMYRMTDEFHDRIPQILANRMSGVGTAPTMTAPTMTTEIYSEELNPVDSPNISSGVSLFVDSLVNSGGYSTNDSILTETLSAYKPDLFGEPTRISLSDNISFSDIVSDIVFEGGIQKTPINIVLNTLPTIIQQLAFTKYTPVNKFTSLSQNLPSTIMMGNRYTPINKFYNR